MTALFSNQVARTAGLLVGLVILTCCFFSSIVFGVLDTSWQTVIDAYTQFNGTNEHIVIKEVRVPRALIAAAVGASLGIAGALLQALTRNPMGDVELFGLNGGAALAIVIGVSFFSMNSLTQFAWLAFAGAAISGIAVYLIGGGGKGDVTPVKLTLAGAAITALAGALVYGLLTLNEEELQEVLFWLAGSVAGRELSFLTAVLPYLIVGWLGSILIAAQVQTLLMGDDVAKGLGQRTVLIKIAAGAVIVLLCGSAVAVAGPIGFVGLITPHLARYLVGLHMRWIFAYSAVMGAILLLAADIGARFLAFPGEVPIGVVTAFLGAPFFLYVARKGLS